MLYIVNSIKKFTIKLNITPMLIELNKYTI